MKKLMILLGAVLMLTSCEQDPDFDKMDANLAVYTDHDKDVDLTKMKTYYLPDSILEAGGHKATYWNDENSKAIVDKVAANMDKRGYERITDPNKKDEADLGLQLTYVAKNTQVVTTGGFGGWWDYGFWGPWWGGWYYPYPVSYSYDTNSLIIEMVGLDEKNGQTGTKDSSSLPVVWYASASGFDYGGRYNQRLLESAVNQAFMQSQSYMRSLINEK